MNDEMIHPCISFRCWIDIINNYTSNLPVQCTTCKHLIIDEIIWKCKLDILSNKIDGYKVFDGGLLRKSGCPDYTQDTCYTYSLCKKCIKSSHLSCAYILKHCCNKIITRR